ncbi:ABC transporter permease subunit [Conexibacter sp. W3-3-2]|uniref:Iron ABC transporter permease n=1 Tax=Paraconexibacter algicola TaxID=2133960 RepID=A0A2T4UGB0_9ACTN|nr:MULTISPECIES: iron ABC transporter permease [Solirubrobacterales]MTD44514.1 ABC transporter permease subunit [Conexibacter sp. W3-3-2]PTL58266.1 iron ABC transporter permease [Paraconexibacter algicola]
MGLALATPLRRRIPPPALTLAGAACAAVVAVPLVYLAIVIGDHPDAAWEALWRERTARLIGRSLLLAAAVSLSASVLALTLAWLTVRTDLPGRRLWSVLVVLPFVIPSYIGAYLFVSALGPGGVIAQTSWIFGFWGAWLVLTLFTYPLVLLPVRAALRRLDPALEEAARGMGRRPFVVFATVVVPQLIPALGAGALLAIAYSLADFGAVSILRFDSFTRVIYQSYKASFDRTGAAALAALLVVVIVLVVIAERRIRGDRGRTRVSPGVARAATPVALGRWTVPALLFCGLVVAVALVIPVATLIVWSGRAFAGDPDWGRLLAAAGRSLATAGLAAGAAVLVALPIALLSARHPGRISRVLDTVAQTGYVLPGLVVALALVFVGTRVAPWAYQTLGIVVFALVVHFLPLALGSMRTALLQVPRSVEEAGRNAGRGPLAVWATITAPLAMGGTLAGAALVFLTTVKELPTLILLAPTGYETLATRIWSQSTVSAFEAGALPALLLLAVSAPPLFLLAAKER